MEATVNEKWKRRQYEKHYGEVGGESVHTATEHSIAAADDDTFHLGISESSLQSVGDALPHG